MHDGARRKHMASPGPTAIARCVKGPVPLLATVLLSGCSPASVLRPAGPIAEGDLSIMLNALAIMLAIVIPTIVATLGVAWWFRAGNPRARFRPNFVYSGRVELIVWSIPILVILFLGGVIWIGSHDLDPARPIASNQPPLEVDVVSLDWKWLFLYPHQQVATINQLVLPVGAPVHFRLTSASVMNSFFVPRLGSQIYTMNGMETQLNLRADKAGLFYGQSAHFSGDGFSDMHFAVQAIPTAQFADWVKAARGSGRVLDAKAYAPLARPTRHVPAATLRLAEPHLFEAILRQPTPPSPSEP